MDAYFQAMQENRQLDVLNLYDPADLETWAQMYGMTLDEFKSQMASAEAIPHRQATSSRTLRTM